MTAQAPPRTAPLGAGPRRPRRSVLLVAATAAAGGFALGSVLAGPSTSPRPADGVPRADESVVRLVDSCIAAMNAEDPDAVSATFADDAVLTDLVDRRITTGAVAIGLAYGQTENLGLRRTSDVVVLGEHVAFATEDADGEASVVAEVDDGVFTQYVVTGTP
jgi:hypothetical protein